MLKAEVNATLLIALSLTILLAVGVGHYLFPRHHDLTPPARRVPLGAISVTTLDGERWSAASHNGEILVINLWATWCGPCREEVPGLSRIALSFRARGVEVLGVSLDRSSAAGETAEDKVRAYSVQMRIPYALALAGGMSQLDLGLDAVPTTLLVDRRGRVATVFVEEVSEEELRSDLDVMLSEST